MNIDWLKGRLDYIEENARKLGSLPHYNERTYKQREAAEILQNANRCHRNIIIGWFNKLKKGNSKK